MPTADEELEEEEDLLESEEEGEEEEDLSENEEEEEKTKAREAEEAAREEAHLFIVEPRKDAPEQLYPFMQANPSALPAFVKYIVTNPTHAAWLGEAVKAAPSLAGLTDADGQHAFAFAHWDCKQACGMPTTDEDALRAIRAASTALQRWWPEGESPRSWEGVWWSDDHVQVLDLSESGLEELPPQIGQLTALTSLDLFNCKQLKELPPQVGQLTALTDLNLFSCEQLNDSSIHQLKELPPQIGQLTALTNLCLHGCEQLKELPPQIGQLTALTDLNLFSCEQLKELPPQIGQLTALTNLCLHGCEQLKELPPQIGQLTALTNLDLSACKQLKELPPQIGQLTALTNLNLYQCWELKELPPQIGQLTALAHLSLYLCKQLKELPPQIGQLLALTYLRLDNCEQLKLAPGAEEGQPAQTIVAAYAPLLIVEPRKDAPSELLAFLRATPPAVPPFYKTILTDAAHAAWLGEAVKATPELAKLTDAIGRRAIDASHPECKRAMQAALFLLGRFDVDDGPPEHRSATSVVIRADDHAGKPDYAQIFEDADTNKSGTLELNEVDKVAKKLLGLSKDLVVSEATKQGSATSADGLSKEAFVSACKRLLGDGPRKVVIKLMKDKMQWQREMISRSWEWDAATDKYMPSQNKVTLDAQYVVQALDAPTQKQITDAMCESPILQDLADVHMKISIKEYVYPVVMDAANRNLAQIYLQERPGPDALRVLARQIFEAVQHLHSRKLMHGDLKVFPHLHHKENLYCATVTQMLNLVRSIMDGKLRLIDFDAFASIIEGGDAGESYACAKFSSGVLPPEALYELKGEERSQFDAYWKEIKDKDKDLWKKVQPMEGKQGKQYVVKTFRTGNDGNPINDGLPYELLPASASLDMWSLGVMLYVLLTGENLVPVTRDDDFVSGSGMGYVFDWDDNKLREKLLKVEDPAAYSLLLQLLSPDAKERCKKSLKSLLEKHPFFDPSKGAEELKEIKQIVLQNNERLREVQAEQEKHMALLTAIKELSAENKTELRRTREVLMKCIFEATEVSKPTTFIVLNEELEPTSEEEKKQLMHEIAEDGSGVIVTGELASVTLTEDGPRVEAEGKCKEYVDKFNTSMKWVHRLKTIGSKVAAGKVGDAFDTIKEGLGDLVTGETMYLYLVDELTCEPVRAEGYPIEIKKPSEIVHKLLPVMQVGLRAMSIYNGAGGIARLFGFPVPKVPKAWATGARESVELLKQESSVAQFGVVHDEAMEGNEESKSVRGQSLRDFYDFLQEHDPGLKAGNSGHFAGLQRIGDPNDGTALWTMLTDPQAIKSALEARTREREAELRAGNKYIQEQAAGIARTPSNAANDVETLRAELKAARKEEAKARAEAATARKDAETARREAMAAKEDNQLDKPEAEAAKEDNQLDKPEAEAAKEDNQLDKPEAEAAKEDNQLDKPPGCRCSLL